VHRRHAFVLPLGFISGLSLSWMGACTVPNPDHCVNNGGDVYCKQQHPDAEEIYCSDNSCVDEITHDGCQEELPMSCWYCDGRYEPECSDMATGDGDGDMTGDGDGDMTGDGDGDMTGDGDGDTPCAGPADCPSADAPFCDELSGMCVACDGATDPDAACAGLDPALPVCAMGTCVACAEGQTDACMDTTPICDVASNSCVGCSSHAQCPDTACNLDAGNCFDPASVIHVAGDDLDCDNGGDGSEAAPFCDLASALINAPAEPLIILHELFEEAAYQEDTVVMNTIALFAADGELPRLQGVNNNPAITVGASGTLFMRGVRISGTAVEGFRVSGGSAWIDQGWIVNNSGGGIVVAGGGMCRVTNSFVGGDVSDRDAVSVTGGSAEVVYTTMLAGFGTSSALSCDDGSGTSVRNSLVVSRSDDDEIQCPSVTVTTSATELDLGGDNTSLGAFDTAWLVPEFAQGDFSLSGNQPAGIATAAIWLTGDPATDIDGEPRPETDGAEDFAGADRL